MSFSEPSRHPVEPAIQQLRREYALEAIDGAINQFSAANRFFSLGSDELASAAFQRGIEFVRLARPEVKALDTKQSPKEQADADG